jgi:predicted nucleotidyltransferase
LEEYVVNRIIAEHQHAIVQVCLRFRVVRLEVFGSAAAGEFDDQRSDLDFIVEFGDVPDAERFDAFFGLQRCLAELFGRPVDLVEAGAPRNPYFIRRLNETRRLVYAA